MGWCMENCKCHSYLHHHRWTSEIKKNKQQKALHVRFANSLPYTVAMADELVEGEKFKYHVCVWGFFQLFLTSTAPPQHFYQYLILWGHPLFATVCLQKKLREIFFQQHFSLTMSMLFYNGEWHINDVFYGVWTLLLCYIQTHPQKKT